MNTAAEEEVIAVIMKEKVYIETTIPSYLTARPSKNVIISAHQKLTKKWWHEHADQYFLYTGPITFEEAGRGDPAAARQRQKMLDKIDVLEPNLSIEKLAEMYAQELGIPLRARADALHLAYAVFYKMDYLLTWNCAHLANAHIRVKLLKVNQKLGLKNTELCTPEQLMEAGL
jgi:hypothetical protein